MIHVVGGTYLELCLEPPWDELFGSGGRAAAALSSLDSNVSLSTYVDSTEGPTLDIIAATLKFQFHATSIPRTISFEYHHGLSEPRINPPTSLIQRAESILVKDVNILRFGFLEGDGVVHGENVVYDPQNVFNPRPFGENGSTAKRLAIVANSSECLKLTNSSCAWHESEVLGKALLEQAGAEVVVVKRGSLGATVVTSGETRNIPAYRTQRVWPIGSGDVFAAVFASYWASEQADPFTAADRASLATAYYCDTKKLPIPADFVHQVKYPPIEQKNDFPLSSKQVYLAGPFFTMAERWIINQARKHLAEHGFKVFSPLHDVGYGTATEVAPADIEGLKCSDIVFAILDGLDAGTVFEIGYARSLNKPVVVFVQNEADENLKMLVGTNCEIVDDFVSAIYRTVWAAMQI
jgi:hypothetical protein